MVGILRKAPAIYVLHTRGRMLLTVPREPTPRHPFLSKEPWTCAKTTKAFCGRRRSRNLKLSDRKVCSRYLCSGFSEWGKWLPRHGFYRSRTRVSGLGARCITSMLSTHIKYGSVSIIRMHRSGSCSRRKVTVNQLKNCRSLSGSRATSSPSYWLT